MLEREAIIALCHLDRAQACAYMRQHWLAGAPQRTMAAELLGLARTSAAFELLLELLGDPQADTRRKALASLASFASEDALRVLTAHQDPDPQTQRQLLRSRQELRRRVHHPLPRPGAARARSMGSPRSCSARSRPSGLYGTRLSAALPPGLIADSASSRRYAVELGLFERQGDVYRVSGMGAAVHWVEGYLQTGVRRYGGQPADVTSADVDTGA